MNKRPTLMAVEWLIAAVLLIAALAVAGGLAYARFREGRPALRDFVSFYTGASLLREAGAARLYSLPDQRRQQAALAPQAPFLPYLRPPLFAALLAPLARAPLERAALVWVALNALAALALGVWCARRMGEPLLLLPLALFVPLLVALGVGQDTPLLVLAAALWLRLLEKEQGVAAGLLLALLWVKPQWVPALVLLPVARRQWRSLGAFAAASALIGALFPPLPYARFLALMHAAPGVPACVPCMPNLRALLPWLPLVATATAAVLGMAFLGARRVPLPAGFGLACCAALLAGFYTHVYDCLLLMPALAAAGPAAAGRARRVILGLALSPLPYLLPYWSEPLRVVPALTVLAVFLALADFRYFSSAPISSLWRRAYSEALDSEKR